MSRNQWPGSEPLRHDAPDHRGRCLGSQRHSSSGTLVQQSTHLVGRGREACHQFMNRQETTPLRTATNTSSRLENLAQALTHQRVIVGDDNVQLRHRPTVQSARPSDRAQTSRIGILISLSSAPGVSILGCRSRGRRFDPHGESVFSARRAACGSRLRHAAITSVAPVL
jgi:hypothetical protein